MELAQDLLPQSAAQQIVAGARGLGRIPQAAFVIGARAGEQLQQPFAPAPALGCIGVLLLALQLDPAAVGEQLQGAFEVDVLGLLDELENVPPGLAAEAVVDLLRGVDPKGGGTLLVERT